MTGAENNPPLRSQNRDIPSYVTFRNSSSRKIDVFWLDYKGLKVKYIENFAPGNVHHMNTYVTHPWIARDSVTDDILLLNGKDVYFPKPWDGSQQRTLVQVHVPVYKLTRRCIQVLKDNFPDQAIPELEIPRTLIEDLLHKPRVQYTEYKDMLKD